MKIKKYAIWLIGLILIIVAGTIYFLFIHKQLSYSQNQNMIHEGTYELKGETITIEERTRFLEFAKSTLESYFEEELAIIDPTIRSIQTDGLQKYLVILDSIGMDSDYNIDIYHYYMVIHNDPDDRLYIMPFGAEIIKGEADKVRQDLLISMLKSVNGWGLKREETWQRWQDAMLNMNYKNTEWAKGKRHNTETIFYTQSLIYFIDEYITTMPDKAFMQISTAGFYQKVMDFEIKSITDVNECEESYAVVEGKVRVYEKERIRDYKVEMTYKVKCNKDRTFTIIEQNGRIK